MSRESVEKLKKKVTRIFGGKVAVNIETFKHEYSRAVFEGYAAIFAGAGLSRNSGYVSWKELLRPLANAINLDIDKEYDFIAVAQYYLNEMGTRSEINQKILNEFTKNTTENENIDIITRLKIYTYWTTNYDELIENSLKKIIARLISKYIKKIWQIIYMIEILFYIKCTAT